MKNFFSRLFYFLFGIIVLANIMLAGFLGYSYYDEVKVFFGTSLMKNFINIYTLAIIFMVIALLIIMVSVFLIASNVSQIKLLQERSLGFDTSSITMTSIESDEESEKTAKPQNIGKPSVSKYTEEYSKITKSKKSNTTKNNKSKHKKNKSKKNAHK